METFLPRLTDYWDQQANAIDAYSRALGRLPEHERATALHALESAVSEHVQVLPDELLPHVMLAASDDLYKAACSIDRWDGLLDAYLAATAGTLFRLLRERGLILHYVVDNAFPDGMQRPLLLFPDWYEAARITYVCPQHVARQLMTNDVGDAAVFEEHLPRYLSEARHVSGLIVERCLTERRHLALLDTDEDATATFQATLRLAGTSGVLTVLRTQPPEPGTTVQAWLPGGGGRPVTTPPSA